MGVAWAQMGEGLAEIKAEVLALEGEAWKRRRAIAALEGRGLIRRGRRPRKTLIVLEYLAKHGGAATFAEMTLAVGMSRQALGALLSYAVRRGRVIRTGRGMYALPDGE